MATRLNKRFIFILTAVIIVLGLGVGAVAFIAISGDAGRQVRLAQELEAEGNYVDATDRYGRAITKDPTNLEYYDFFENSLLKIVPESRAEARDRYNQYLAVLGRRKNVSVDNPESWARLVEEFNRRADLLGPSAGDVWADVQDQAERMYEEFRDETDPEGRAAAQLARVYVLKAMSNRLDLLKPKEQIEFDVIASELLEAECANSMFWEAVLRRRIEAASRHLSKGDTRLVAIELEGDGGFDELQQAMEAIGEVEMSPRLLALLAKRHRMDPENPERQALFQQRYDQLVQIGQELVAEILASGSEGSNNSELLRVTLLSGLLRIDDVVPIIEPLIESGQLDLDLSLMMFQNLAQSKPEFASRAARHALAVEPLTVGLMSILQSVARQQASIALFDATYSQVAMKNEGVSIVDLKIAREEASKEFQGEPAHEDVLLYMNASIALMENDAPTATTKFAKLVNSPLVQSSIMQRRYIPRMVASLLMAGERGVAIEKLRAYASNMPPAAVVGIRVAIGRELLAIGRLEDATAEIEKALATDPENEAALIVMEEIISFGEDISTEAIGARTPQSRAFSRATSALADARPEDARAVLLMAIDTFEDNVPFKRMLITVDILLDNREEARELAMSIEGYEDDTLLKRQLIILDNDDPIERINALVDFGYENESDQNAMKFIYLEALYRNGGEGSEESLSELPGVFDNAIANLSGNRGIRQRFMVSAVQFDRQESSPVTSDSYVNRALAAFEVVETDEVQIRNTKARIAAVTGDPAAAVKYLQPLLERGLGNAETWHLLGLSYSDIGQTEQSKDAFSNAVKRAPDNARYVLSYADALEKSGELEKALNLLRVSRRSQALGLQIRDSWLSAESKYGDQKAALNQRALIYSADIEDATSENDVIDTSNALEFSRLLLVVPIDRTDIRKDGKPRFSANSWSGMSGINRREVIAKEREARRELAFKIISEVKNRSQSESDRASVMMIKAQAHSITDEQDLLKQELDKVIECCDDILNPDQRFRIIDMLSLVNQSEAIDDQFRQLAEVEDLKTLRSMVVKLNQYQRGEMARDISSRIYESTGSISDAMLYVNACLNIKDLEQVADMIAAFEVDEELVGNKNLTYQFHLLDSNYQGLSAQALIMESLELDKQQAEYLKSDQLDKAVQVAEKAKKLRDDAENSMNRGLEAVEAAREIAPGQVLAILRKHEILRAKALMLGGAAYESDVLANAREARDMAPIDWRTNRCLMEAHLMMGKPSDALSALDQYFRRGGMSPDARSSIMNIARIEGKPGLAIPALQRAMERDTSNPLWPLAIARLLIESGDVPSAADMWWRVLEIDPSAGSITEFVALEFRRDEPNMSRISEALEMRPDLVDANPDLKAARSVSMVMSGDQRRGERAYEISYLEALELLASSGEHLPLERVLTYFDKVFPDDGNEKVESRLSGMNGKPVGPYVLKYIAESYARQGATGESATQAAEYFKRAIEICEEDDPLRNRMLTSYAAILYMNGECSGAIDSMKDMVESGAATANSLNNLAYMLLECDGDASTAVYYSTQALQLAPSSPQFLDTHGYILLKLGQMEASETFLSRAVQIKPSVNNLIHYAELMLLTDRRDEAEILVEKIGKDFPTLTEDQQNQVNDLIAQIG
jgi:tetratricopeptide (TPR) repeat protein